MREPIAAEPIPAAAATQTVIAVRTGPLPEPGAEAWLGVGAALLALACAASLAHRRRRIDAASSRLLRIFAAASLFAGSLTLWLVVDALWRWGGTGQLTPMALLAVAAFLAIAMILFGIADFWLGLLRPVRSSRWLAASALLFALLIAACLAIASLADDMPSTAYYYDMAAIVLMAAAAGIAWWSYLPAHHDDLAKRFD